MPKSPSPRLSTTLAILIACLVSLVPATAEAKNDGRDLWREAYDAYNDHRYDEAAETFEAAAEAGYRPAVATYNAGCSYALAGRDAEALDAVERSVELGLDSPRLLAEDSDLDSLRGDDRFQALIDEAFDRADERRHPREHHRYRDAMDRLERLRRSGSTEAREWYEVGTRLLMMRQLDVAVEALDQAAQLESESPAVAFYNLACAHALDGRAAEAFEALEKAIETGYTDPDHMRRDPDLRSLREDTEFDRLIQLAEDLDFDRFRAGLWQKRGHWWRGGRNMYSDDYWVPAIEFYTGFTEENPNLGAGWFHLGYALHYSRRFEESVDAFERAAELGFRPATSTYNTACGYSMLDRVDQGLAALEESIDLGFHSRDLRDDDDLDNLRSDPRFDDLRQKARRGRKS